MLEYVMSKLPISWQYVQYCAVQENIHASHRIDRNPLGVGEEL